MEKTDIRSAFEAIKKDETLVAVRAGKGMQMRYYFRNAVLRRKLGGYEEKSFDELDYVFSTKSILSDWTVIPISDL